MYQVSAQFKRVPYSSFEANDNHFYEAAPIISCNWQALRAQLLLQWKNLTARELDKAGPNRRRIALLIEEKYGVAASMIENYLRNFERTMPLTGHS